jgi:hypothetical protein
MKKVVAFFSIVGIICTMVVSVASADTIVEDSPTINDTLEILKYLAKLPSDYDKSDVEPVIGDALDILKYLAKMEMPENWKPIKPLSTTAINENGETFGSASFGFVDSIQVILPGDLPELTRVEGDNGIVGYVRTSELNDESPSSPEEAVRMMQEREKYGATIRILNVYQSDGVTVIDTFTKGKYLLYGTETIPQQVYFD